jgi:hypothetical protein
MEMMKINEASSNASKKIKIRKISKVWDHDQVPMGGFQVWNWQNSEVLPNTKVAVGTVLFNIEENLSENLKVLDVIWSAKVWKNSWFRNEAENSLSPKTVVRKA